MIKTSTLSFIALALCALMVAFIRQDDVPLDKLVTSLQRWTDSIPQEKVYLHMDKPYYALGDTIWFKGYLTIGSRHQLSALSGAMYVDLINEKDSVLQELKLPVTLGMVMGNFILKDDYPQGNYRVRGYTQWMRNAGEDYFYDHTFLVGDIAGGEIIAKADFSFRDNQGKQALTALLNYKNQEDKALADRSLRYEIWANHKALWQQNTRTDAKGNVQILIPDEIRQHPEGAYVHTILQGSDKYPVYRDFPVKVTLAQSDVQFFPESGALVNGITSRVAFKATDIDGLGVPVTGSITDNSHQEVARLETLHAGMGSFQLNPQAGKTYTANVVFEDGSTKNIVLPKALDEGYVLSVYQPNKDSVLVRIYASKTLQQSAVNLLVHTGGEVAFASPVKLEKAITSVWLEKRAFSTGIAQFTLFNNNGEPLNERIAFVRSNDLMQLEIKSSKPIYAGKERAELVLSAKDSKEKPTFGNFSVSVVDENKVPVDEDKESTIFSNLLLTSDLKGYIEQPNYYFAETGDAVDKALDNLMLTQGYRRFAWKDINSTAFGKPQYPAESLGTVLSGRVMTLNNMPKPVAGATITLVALRAKLFKTATADANGYFKFEPIFATDSIKFTLQARTAKGSDKVGINIDSIPGSSVNHNPNLADANLSIHNTLKQYLESGKKEDNAYEKLGLLDKVHRLKEVKIRAQAAKPKPAYNVIQGPFQIPDGHADRTFKIPQPELCMNLATCLQGMLPRVIFMAQTVVQNGTSQTFASYPVYTFAGQSHLLNVILDGRLLGAIEAGDVLNNNDIDATDVVKVDYVYANMALMGILDGPALLIYTKRGKVKKFYNPSIANMVIKGYNKAREFYSPRYNSPKTNLTRPDLRTTVFWSPYLKTDANGKTTFSFYNADGPGSYKVTIEGINAEGQLGRQVYRYTVNETQANIINTKP